MVQVLLSRQDVDINMRDKVCPSQWKYRLNFYHTCHCIAVDKVHHKSLTGLHTEGGGHWDPQVESPNSLFAYSVPICQLINDVM